MQFRHIRLQNGRTFENVSATDASYSGQPRALDSEFIALNVQGTDLPESIQEDIWQQHCEAMGQSPSYFREEARDSVLADVTREIMVPVADIVVAVPK